MNRDAPRIAFVVYDHMTVLDCIGIYDPLTRLKSMGFLPALTWDVCALQPVARDDSTWALAGPEVRRKIARQMDYPSTIAGDSVA